MTAYVVFLREGPIRDAEALQAYRQAPRGKESGTITPLAVYGAIEALEGDAPDGAVIMAFPSVEEARAWYESPEYKAATVHRRRAADYRGFIIEGFSPPVA